MNRSLFPTSYPDDYERAWKLYRSRCESENCMRKDEGFQVWNRTRNLRPELPIMLGCIKLYLDQVESAKRVIRNGRDEKVTYYKLHFATFLSPTKLAWRDFVERATASQAALSQIPATEARTPVQRRVISSEEYLDTLRTTSKPQPLKSIRQILAERRGNGM